MKRLLSTLLAIGAFAFATTAQADLKCGDAPYAFAEGDLVDAWIGPIPKDARVRYVDGQIFEALERQTLRDTADELAKNYREGLKYVGLANAQISTSVDAAAEWLKRYNITLEYGPAKTFQGYIDRGHYIFSTLIEHPAVANFEEFIQCSIVLQWGIIVMNEGQETLYLRSYFHSTDGKGNFVNFAPRGGLQISFPSEAAWFPLELTKYISEPSAQVIIDVVTPSATKLSVPSPFDVENANAKVTLGAQDYFVTRLKGELEGGKDWPDLVIEVGSR